MPDAQDILMGAGGTTAKFSEVGDEITGTIACEPEAKQQKDFTTEKPKFFDNGDPMMQVIVTLDTAIRDDADDDGVRRLYLKAGSLKAVRAAVKAAKSKRLEIGAQLTVKYIGNGTPTKPGLNPPKEYVAVYTPPQAAKAASALGVAEPARPAAIPAEQWEQMTDSQKQRLASAYAA